MDDLIGKTIKEAEVDGFGIHITFADGSVFDYDASDGGYSQYELTEATADAQVERKKGTWTNDGSCPFCGFQPWYERDIHTLSFCSNCGADMRE